jgi:serine protease
MPDQYVPRVIVKFEDTFVDSLVDEAADLFLDRLRAGDIKGANWRQLVAQPQFQGITIEKLLKAVSQTELCNLMNLAFRRNPSYRFFAPNFLTYFAIPCPAKVNPETVAHALLEWDPVETAYVAEAPADEPVHRPVNFSQNFRWSYPDSGYMRAAPGGIDAQYAWLQPGGDGGNDHGVNLQFFDIESNWDLTHPDLPDQPPAAPQFTGTGISHRKAAREYHGTGVLGIVIGADSNPTAPYNQSSLGITPKVAVTKVDSYWVDPYNTDHFNTILRAIQGLNFGDVLLLETQVNLEDSSGTVVLGNLPVEFFQHNFDVIRLGTALGVVIVEAAGNGGYYIAAHDLDDLSTTKSLPWLRKNNDPKFDSGAIMVSAATPWDPPTYPNNIHKPIMDGNGVRLHNFGSRIDCYAWGDSIHTPSSLPHPSDTPANPNPSAAYYQNFGDTSGASAIIAGAALSVQGMAEANLGYRLSPLQIRNLLSDDTTGTDSLDPTNDRLGVMPNLRAIINTTLGITPDVYIRDFVGDTGDPHTGSISSSPDIILRRSLVADPQGEFGELNLMNKDNVWLSETAVPGQNHYIYVRVRNRGAVAATNVKATVYWSEPATLVTPDTWNLIGQTGNANIPPNDVLTVLPPITWSAIPGTGHYCFVALIGSPTDPSPLKPADFLNWPGANAWDLYQRFIRENNNVTWRNFDVVVYPLAPRNLYIFHIAGMWSQAAPMWLEVVSRLPAEARLSLQVSDEDWKVLSALKGLGPVESIEMEDRTKWLTIRLNPHGRSRTQEILFPREFRSRCRLLLDLPERIRKDSGEVSIRQYSQNQEVGRMTWRLIPKSEGDQT